MGFDAAGMPTGWSLFDDKKLSLGLGIATRAATFLRLVSFDLRARSIPDMLQLIKISLVADVFCICAALNLQLSATERGITAEDDVAGISWMRSPLPVTVRSTPFAAVMDIKSGSDYDVDRGGLQGYKGNYMISTVRVPLIGVQMSPAGGKPVVSEQLLLVAEHLMCVMYNMLAVMRSQQQQGSYVEHLQPHEVERIRRALDAASAHPPHTFVAQAARWAKDLLA